MNILNEQTAKQTAEMYYKNKKLSHNWSAIVVGLTDDSTLFAELLPSDIMIATIKDVFDSFYSLPYHNECFLILCKYNFEKSKLISEILSKPF